MNAADVVGEITLAEWFGSNDVPRNVIGGSGIQVFSMDPALWNLSDYVVSSAVSGPSVILVRRTVTR